MRGKVVLPDIYASGGGATASYFEWAQVMNVCVVCICVGDLLKK